MAIVAVQLSLQQLPYEYGQPAAESDACDVGDQHLSESGRKPWCEVPYLIRVRKYDE
jgi:hypothetical protein